MTDHLTTFVRCLKAGDAKSAARIWESTAWTDLERARARRLVRTAGEVSAVVAGGAKS